MSRKALVVGSFCIVLATCLAYANAIHGAFLFDDQTSIVEDQSVQHHDWEAMWKLHSTRYTPYASFALQTAWWGNNVIAFHTANIALHCITALTLFAFLLIIIPSTKYRFWLALGGSLVFALHPIQTQAVSYIVQRISIMAALGSITTLTLYTYGRLHNQKKYIVAAWVCAIATMFTKETAVTLPLTIVALEFTVLRTPLTAYRSYAIRIGLFLAIMCIIPLTLFATRGVVTSEPVIAQAQSDPTPTPTLPPAQYFFTETTVIMRYISLIVLPIYQTVDHDIPTQTSAFSFPVIASEVCIAILLIIAWKLRVQYPLISFGIFFFFISLLLESTIFPIEDVMFEHRLYLPMAGVAIFTVGLIDALQLLQRYRLTLSCLAVLVLTTYAYATHERNIVWNDAISLWQDAVHTSPHKVRPAYNLAAAYALQGNDQEATLFAKQVLAINPRYALASTLLGVLAYQHHDLAAAESYLRTATHDQPELVDPHIILSTILGEEGKFDASIQESQAALALSPSSLSAQVNLASAYIGTQQYEKAIAILTPIVTEHPDATLARTALMKAQSQLTGQ